MLLHVCALAKTNAVKKQGRRGRGKMKAMIEINRRRKFLAVGKACMAISDLLQAVKVEHRQLWVLNKGDLNFCVRDAPVRDW